MYKVTAKDVKNAEDKFCYKCKTKKTKYLGKLMGTPAVLWRDNCSCEDVYSHTDKDKKMWEHINTPFWVHAGQKPTAQEKKRIRYMKSHNLSWGDMRKMRDHEYAKTQGAKEAFEKHIDKYGRRNEPELSFNKNN